MLVLFLCSMRLLVLVFASIFSVAHAQSDTTSSAMQKIKILSWNIYMLPGFLGYGKLERSEAIGNQLAKSDYDVIVFQEAFYGPARKHIHQLLKSAFPFQAGPANKKLFSLRTNSGLWIFSKHPILTTMAIAYETRYGIDAMSRKGALLVELAVGGQRIQVIATHLQNSGNSWRKQGQCAELFHKILKHYERPGVPQIICGDFNIDRYQARDDYEAMLNTLRATDSDLQTGMFSYDRLTNDLEVEAGTSRELIDFVLTRTNEVRLLFRKQTIKVLRQAWHANHNDLSDHYAIEAELEFHYERSALTASVR